MWREHIGSQFWQFPAGEEGCPAVVERGIIADRGRKRLEQMLGEHPFARIKFDVAVEDKAGIAYDGNWAPVALAALHVVLVEGLVIVGIEATTRYFVKAHHVPLRN